MTPHEPMDDFEERARAVHAASLEHLSPRVRAQLVQRRRTALDAAPRRRTRGVLAWAGVATAGVALALVMQLRPPSADVHPAAVSSARTGPAAVDTRMASAGDAEAVAPDLSEDPEFYVWLGDASPARME